MSQSDVEKIKERLGIEEVVGAYIKLEKAGKNLKARCPFHSEKTPSFIVSPDRGTYYCFGCHAGGDIFSFIQEFEGIDFSGALKILADRAGITLSSSPKQKSDENALLRKILNLSVQFYQVCLSRNKEALSYLENRGLKIETIKDWQLGFAPNEWEKLFSFLKLKNYKIEDIEKIGLIKRSEKGKYYDRFRSRIMFPIFDPSGRPIGFSGRIFNGKEDEAKYINSPETVLFDKSKVLYGFDRAKGSIRKNDFSILVEGQMDLILSHQAGYKNTVASSGTALTKDQLDKIARISEKMVIAYDSDRAGFKASEKAWQMALSLGMDVKIAQIPKDSDPADILQEDPKRWIKIIKESRHIVEIVIEKIKNETEDKRALGKRVSRELVPYLANIASKIDQDHFVEMTHERLNLSADSIREEIKIFENNLNHANQNILSGSRNIKDNNLVNKKEDLLSTERALFGIIFWQEQAKDKQIEVEPLKDKVKKIMGDFYSEISEKLFPEKEALIFRFETLIDNNSSEDFLKRHIDEVLKYLEIKYLSKKIEILKRKLREEDKIDSNSAKSSFYQEEIQKISEKIDSLKDG